MAQVFAIKNRIPTSHCSDTPLLRASDVNYYPGADDISMMTDWCKYTISRALVTHFPAFGSCMKHLRLKDKNKWLIFMCIFRPPKIKYPRKMSEKSESCFLTMKTEDPASNAGIISLYKVRNLCSKGGGCFRAGQCFKALILLILTQSSWIFLKISQNWSFWVFTFIKYLKLGPICAHLQKD